MTERRTDIRALRSALNRAGITNKKLRKYAYMALAEAKKTGDLGRRWETVEGKNVAASVGFRVWEYIPLELRREWILQPD